MGIGGQSGEVILGEGKAWQEIRRFLGRFSVRMVGRTLQQSSLRSLPALGFCGSLLPGAGDRALSAVLGPWGSRVKGALPRQPQEVIKNPVSAPTGLCPSGFSPAFGTFPGGRAACSEGVALTGWCPDQQHQQRLQRSDLLILKLWGHGSKCAFLTNSHVIPLVQGPHFENHWLRRVRSLFSFESWVAIGTSRTSQL